MFLYSAMRRIIQQDGMTNFISLNNTNTSSTYTLLVAQSGIYDYIRICTSYKCMHACVYNSYIADHEVLISQDAIRIASYIYVQ